MLASKQVGDLSYFVENQAILRRILLEGNIKTSSPKVNYDKNIKSRYVSMSRNMTSSASRNNLKWRYGVIIDGDKLSNRYAIRPYSYVGVNLDHTSNLKVAYIQKYDTGVCKLSLAGFAGTYDISNAMYEHIRNLIMNCPEDFKNKKKLTIHGPGKYKTKYGKVEEKVHFNVPSGGIKLSSDMFKGTNLESELLKTSGLDEQEERIWTDKEFIKVVDCIKGLIIPDKLSDDEQQDIHKTFLVADMCLGDNYKVITY